MGAAISGIMVVAGENICGMDKLAELKNGRIVRSRKWKGASTPSNDGMTERVASLFRPMWKTPSLAFRSTFIEKLGIEIFELKWGQGAKDIGGEVKLSTMERARQLKERGYIVLPDPTTAAAERAFSSGGISEFERHSRLGMVTEEGFYNEVKRLRGLGAKYVTLKTGAYRPADLARAIKFASNAQIDLLTIDGAGGGTE